MHVLLPFADMYEFNFPSKSWRLLHSVNHPPTARDRHTAVVTNKYFYIFGGFDGVARINGNSDLSCNVLLICKIYNYLLLFFSKKTEIRFPSV